MPFFSIIIPTFNRSHIIRDTINTVMLQTFTDFELIISDDGSTDNTKEIITPLLTDSRIKYVMQSNKGVCAARNFGAKHASGKYLIFLDSDDTIVENWLKDFHILAQNNYDILFCSMLVIDTSGFEKKASCLNPYKNGYSKGIFNAGTWAMKREFFFEIGQYDEQIKYGENTELKFRLLDKKGEFGYVDNYNFIYKESISGGSKQTANKLESNLYILSKHEVYFNNNPIVKCFFLQVAAVSAARLEKYKLAHELFVRAWETNKSGLKLIVQCLISLVPFLTKLKWKPIAMNSNQYPTI
ncbi:MAG: glycosyltransferase family A protein [Sphingobacteriales bacterium]|nr:glycosyltransferase family A protein [Sphingobacteriales bacterium]